MPLLAFLAVGLGAWALWQIAQRSASAPPPPPAGALGTGAPGAPAAYSFDGPTLNPSHDGPIAALANTLLGTLLMVGPCATQPTVPTTDAGAQNFAGLVAQRTRAVWAFQRAVKLPTTGCYDSLTAIAGEAYLPPAYGQASKWPSPCASCKYAPPIAQPA